MLFPLAAWLAAVTPLAGQFRPLVGEPVPVHGSFGPLQTIPQDAPGPDSAALHRTARDLQARFERLRLRHLPRTMAGSGGACERVIGRLCIWDGGDRGWTPEPEAPEIVEGRLELLAQLDSLATLSPGNAWILGLRVRYRLEAEDYAGARSDARACGVGESWICHALEGLALHREGDIVRSDAAFDRALTSAPEDLVREWTDPSKLLDSDLRDWFESQPDSLAAVVTLWTWADPFFLVRGNDRWTGHLSRWAHALSSQGTRSPHQMRWADDLTESVVRYGWTVAWERPWPRAGERESSSAVGHEPPTALRYMPKGSLLDGGRDGEGAEAVRTWTLDRKGMTSLYLPPYIDSLAQPAAQWARFPAPGGGTYVLAAAKDRVGSQGDAGLFAHTGGPLLEGRAGTGRGRIWGAVLVPSSDPADPPPLLSLEGLDRGARQGQRTRALVPLRPVPPGVLALSDVVVLDRGPEPTSLEDVARRMRPGPVVGPSDTLTVAFQVSGLTPRTDALSYRVWMERRDRGVFSRVAGWVGLGGDDEPLEVSWTESTPETSGSLLRSVDMVLPDLELGAWDLAVAIQAPGRSEAVQRRLIRVEEPSGGDEG